MRIDISEELQQVQKKLDSIQIRLLENLKRAENPDGVLTEPENAYLDCLQIKKENLDALLERDLAHLQSSLKQARKAE